MDAFHLPFISKLKNILCFAVLALAGLFIPVNSAYADDALNAKTLDAISEAVFEVVVPKPAEDSLSYEKPLPLHLIPYSIRNDKYYAVGTAFAIGPSEFVSAAHVTLLGVESHFKEAAIRDKAGRVYQIDKINGYSERKDFVVFSLKNKRADTFLPLNTSPRVNQKVYAVGNALGEGIVIRDGLYTSNTPEEKEGEWKWIRFSAAASPGNSGGPLFDKDGRVLGIIIGKSPNENLNYALPMSEVVQAKGKKAIAYRPMKYSLDNTDISKIGIFEKEIDLPKSVPELHQEIIEGVNRFLYNILKSLFTAQRENIFPNGKWASALLNPASDTQFPQIITRREDGAWHASQPKEINEAELGNNGYFKYGELGDTMMLYIQKPGDVPLQKFYGDSQLFMDLILKGINLPRKVETEKIKITSLGKARESYAFADSYGRKWLVNVWLLEYADNKLVTFSLPVPGGCVTLLRFGPTVIVNNGHMPDLRIMTNFIHLAYAGDFQQWQEFLQMKELLSASLASLKISFDFGKAFHYSSPRLSFSYPAGVMDISEKSHLKLMPGYFRENNKTIWDIGAIFIGENKNNATSLRVSRNARPSQERIDKYPSDWEAIAAERFPFNRSAYYKDKTTNIAAVVKKTASAASSVYYTALYTRDGQVEQKEMAARLGEFTSNLTVHEDGQGDFGYAARADAYHEKADYFQSLWDDERIAELKTATADGFMLRGDIALDKGDMERALAAYSKASELGPQQDAASSDRAFLALVYGGRGKFKEAARALAQVLKADPFDTTAEPLLIAAEAALAGKIGSETASQLFQGAVFHHRGWEDRAFSAYHGAIARDPACSIAYDIRGLANVFRKDRERALADYSKAIALNPQDVIAYNRRGVVHKLRNEYDAAIADYTKALEINPAYFKALSNRGGIHYTNKDYDRAMADFDAALQAYPLYSDVFSARGSVWFEKGEYDQAIADFNQALQLKPALFEVYQRRARAYHRRGDYEEALQDFEKALEKEPRSSLIYLHRGKLYKDMQDYDKALADFTKALAIDPDFFEAYFYRGALYQERKQLDLAYGDYSKALQLMPKDFSTYNNRGNIQKERGMLAQALEDYTKAIAISPENEKVYVNRGRAYHEQGDLARALADYDKAVELKTKNVDVYLNRGHIHMQGGKFDAALADYHQAIALQPLPFCFFSRAGAYFRKGDFARAIADYSKAIETDPRYEEAYINRGLAYRRFDNQKSALADFGKALELNPKSAKAYLNRGISYSLLGEFAAAMADFQKALELDPRNANIGAWPIAGTGNRTVPWRISIRS